MAETNFTLHSTDTNNYKLQKTFSGVNPEATSAELVETAQGFNRLSDNTYVGTKRIDKLDADTEGDFRAAATLTFTRNTALADYRYTPYYNGTRLTWDLYNTFENKGTFSAESFYETSIGFSSLIENEIRYPLLFIQMDNPVTKTFTITLGGTETHKPVTATVTIEA